MQPPFERAEAREYAPVAVDDDAIRNSPSLLFRIDWLLGNDNVRLGWRRQFRCTNFATLIRGRDFSGIAIRSKANRIEEGELFSSGLLGVRATNEIRLEETLANHHNPVAA